MNTEKSYQIEASELLQKMGVKFSVKFIKYGLHFTEDKDSRDIFRVIFKRENFVIEGGKFFRFSLRFGQSINNSDGMGGCPPSAYDVLACIQKYDVGSFPNFCGDFGYDEDSRKAYKTYLAVCKEWHNVRSFFTDAEIEQLQEIQ